MELLRLIEGIMGSILGKLLAEEVTAWSPTMAKTLLLGAVSCLPKSEQERAAEEWSSDLLETPGNIGKLLFCLDLFRAAMVVKMDFASGRLARSLVLNEKPVAIPTKSVENGVSAPPTQIHWHKNYPSYTVDSVIYGGRARNNDLDVFRSNMDDINDLKRELRRMRLDLGLGPDSPD